MVKPKPLPPLEVLQAHFDYCPETGRLSRKGKTVECGTFDKRGYRQVGFKYRFYLAHRIAWYLYYGVDPHPHEVDHRDRNKSNNRIENLRMAAHGQNGCNRPKQRNNTSGYKGVTYDPRRDAWIARIVCGPVNRHLGQFATAEEAHAAYCAAATELHGEFACTA